MGQRSGRGVVAVDPKRRVDAPFDGPAAGVFEFEVAADGTTKSRIWEWK